MNEFAGKYIGGIIVDNEKDIEKLKKLSLCEEFSEEELKASINKGFAFDINYLEIFWISSERKEILESGLPLVIMKNPDYKE